MSDRRTVEIVVEGRVQGVGYRDWTQRRAVALGLSGSVRNRADGTVAAIVSGPADAVAAMIDACKSGPGAARVDGVSVTERGGEPVPDGFAILYG